MPPKQPGVGDKLKGEDFGGSNALVRMEDILENKAVAAIKIQ